MKNNQIKITFNASYRTGSLINAIIEFNRFTYDESFNSLIIDGKIAIPLQYILEIHFNDNNMYFNSCGIGIIQTGLEFGNYSIDEIVKELEKNEHGKIYWLWKIRKRKSRI